MRQEYMHEYYEIKNSVAYLLAGAKFIEVSENSYLDDYGSIQTLFESDLKRVLLGWNGLDGFGFAKIWKNECWEKLHTKVLENENSKFNIAIKLLCTELNEYL